MLHLMRTVYKLFLLISCADALESGLNRNLLDEFIIN
jgi:hypothetical protein